LSLVVLALLAVSLQSLVFSGASFTGTDQASASFTSGSVSHLNDMAGAFVLDAPHLRPGASHQGTLTITGGPDVPAVYTLTRLSLADVPSSPALSDVLDLTIEDLTAGTTVYAGAASGFTSASLGIIMPGSARQFRFTLAYPTAVADRALLGATTTIELEFAGVSL
jgi:hypothetical protein